jgi:hypothetical protein
MLTDDLKPSHRAVISAGPAKPPAEDGEKRLPLPNLAVILADHRKDEHK